MKEDVFKNSPDFNLNSEIIGFDGRFKCLKCAQNFDSLSKLRMHLKFVHELQDDKFKIGCRTCGKIFNSRTQHMSHRRLVQ